MRWKYAIITILINGFHYSFYFHDWKKEIWKRERERERERVNKVKVTVKLQSKASKQTLKCIINIFISFWNFNLCHLACFHLTQKTNHSNIP